MSTLLRTCIATLIVAATAASTSVFAANGSKSSVSRACPAKMDRWDTEPCQIDIPDRTFYGVRTGYSGGNPVYDRLYYWNHHNVYADYRRIPLFVPGGKLSQNVVLPRLDAMSSLPTLELKFVMDAARNARGTLKATIYTVDSTGRETPVHEQDFAPSYSEHKVLVPFVDFPPPNARIAFTWNAEPDGGDISVSNIRLIQHRR